MQFEILCEPWCKWLIGLNLLSSFNFCDNDLVLQIVYKPVCEFYLEMNFAV